MLDVTILASGSAGNSALVRCGMTRILLDAGLSARQLCARLGECGVAADELDAIVLTHEHSDHTASLRVLCGKRDIPIYATRMTAAALDASWQAASPHWRFFASGAQFSVGDLAIEAFSVPHDAADPVGFVVRNTSASFGLLTDLGHATGLVLDRVREVDTLFVEANYDDELLQLDTRRPWSVKQRISSRHGHLSNREAAAVVEAICDGPLKQVLIGHLSRDCNTAERAVAAVSEPLARVGRGDVPVVCASQDTPSARIPISSQAADKNHVGPVREEGGDNEDANPSLFPGWNFSNTPSRQA